MEYSGINLTELEPFKVEELIELFLDESNITGEYDERISSYQLVSAIKFLLGKQTITAFELYTEITKEREKPSSNSKQNYYYDESLISAVLERMFFTYNDKYDYGYYSNELLWLNPSLVEFTIPKFITSTYDDVIQCRHSGMYLIIHEDFKPHELPINILEFDEYTTKLKYRYDGSMISIKLPPKITVIPENCFKYCSNLEFIHLENITYIGKDAFQSSRKLNLCDLSDTCVIEDNAFDDNIYKQHVSTIITELSLIKGKINECIDSFGKYDWCYGYKDLKNSGNNLKEFIKFTNKIQKLTFEINLDKKEIKDGK